MKEEKNFSSAKPVVKNGVGRKSKEENFQFHWLFGLGDIPESKELLVSSERVIERTGTTIEQAKGTLRADIRAIGGNAALEFCIAKGESTRSITGGTYYPATFYASARAALVVPKSMNEAEKLERKARFLSFNETKKTKPQEQPEGFSRYLLACGFLVVLLFVVAVLVAL